MRLVHRLVLVVLVATAAASAASAKSSRSAMERNKEVARDLFEVVLSKSDWDHYRRIHTPEFCAHATGVSATLEQDLEAAKGWRSAFPDVTVRVERVVAEGDLVAVQWIARGTNTGTGNGLPATGKSVEVGGITIFRMKDGRIAEEWGSMDTYQMMRQLGLLPSP